MNAEKEQIIDLSKDAEKAAGLDEQEIAKARSNLMGKVSENSVNGWVFDGTDYYRTVKRKEGNENFSGNWQIVVHNYEGGELMITVELAHDFTDSDGHTLLFATGVIVEKFGDLCQFPSSMESEDIDEVYEEMDDVLRQEIQKLPEDIKTWIDMQMFSGK